MNERPVFRDSPRRLGDGDDDRRFASFVVGAWVLVAVFAAYVIHGALPHNPLELPAEDRLSVRRLMPQGWSFFTRSPREIDLAVYEPSDGGWVRRDPLWRAHDLGFDRGSRALGIEIGLLLAEVPHAEWTPCDVSASDCLREAPSIRLANRASAPPRLCGAVGMVREEPTPWAWRTSKLSMPLEALRLEVSC